MQEVYVCRMFGVWYYAKISNTENGGMSICWQSCESAKWTYTTVGISWHLGERQAADTKIISTRAAAQWELSSAAVMLLGEQGHIEVCLEKFSQIVWKIKEQTAFLYSTYYAHTVILKVENTSNKKDCDIVCRNVSIMTHMQWAADTRRRPPSGSSFSMWWNKRRKRLSVCERGGGTEGGKGHISTVFVSLFVSFPPASG